MANRLLRYNILIICEGENTEPQYLASLIPLAKKAWESTHKLVIDLKPKPKLVEEPTTNIPSKHKTSRKRRKIKKVLPELTVIEDAFKAVPVRYVREAQQGLEDGTYEEAWAVFDKDYHPKHKEAFELSEKEVDGKKVQIAFSSISFEQWILLHFEKNTTAFIKSECKEKKLPIKCGTNEHSNDCFGEKCISGYLREISKKITNPSENKNTKLFLERYSKSVTTADFNILHNRHSIAFENAAWLRQQSLKSDLKTPIYERNPYTDMDVLVKQLLGIDEEIIWMDFQVAKTILGLTVLFLKKSEIDLEIHLTNKSSSTYLFLPKELYTISNGKTLLLTNSKALIPVGETKVIQLAIDNAASTQINFLHNQEEYRLIISL